jgi:hypothetical protein
MPTKKEANTVAKLMLAIANAFDENRKEMPYDDDETLQREGRMRPEYTLEQLRPMAREAMDEAQKMLASWGKRD